MKTKKIAVTGANGQLGLEFHKVIDPSLEFTYLSRGLLDITDADQVHDAITKIKPDVIINCAAYTAVDRAEEEVAQAFKINDCLLYTSPSPRDRQKSRMPSSA